MLNWHAAFGNCIVAIAGHLLVTVDKLLEARGLWAKKCGIAKCACIILCMCIIYNVCVNMILFSVVCTV